VKRKQPQSKSNRRIGITFAPIALFSCKIRRLVFPISDAGRIVTVTIRVANLTISPMDNNFRMLAFGNRYSVIDCRVLRAVSAG
jgi:hypothetical protein